MYFFSPIWQIVHYFVSWLGELEQSAVFTCRKYTFLFSFLCISTLYTTGAEKKERLVQIQCTKTGQEIWIHTLQSYIHFVQPTSEILMLSGLQNKKKAPLFSIIFFLFWHLHWPKTGGLIKLVVSWKYKEKKK